VVRIAKNRHLTTRRTFHILDQMRKNRDDLSYTPSAGGYANSGEPAQEYERGGSKEEIGASRPDEEGRP